MGIEKEVRIGTRVVRSARALPAGEGIPVAPPLVQSVAFDYRSAAAQDEVFASDRAGFVYGRYGTPTTAAPRLPSPSPKAPPPRPGSVRGRAGFGPSSEPCRAPPGGAT